MKREHTAIRLDPDIKRDMTAIKVRDGIPFAEQIRRALREWIDKRITHRWRP
jgi:hypothetical protein